MPSSRHPWRPNSNTSHIARCLWRLYRKTLSCLFHGYRTIIARYLVICGIVQMRLCETECHGRVSHHLRGVLASLSKYCAMWGIATIVSQYREISLLLLNGFNKNNQQPGDHPNFRKTLSDGKGHFRSSRRVPGHSRSNSRNSKFHSRNTKFHSRNGIPRLEQYKNLGKIQTCITTVFSCQNCSYKNINGDFALSPQLQCQHAKQKQVISELDIATERWLRTKWSHVGTHATQNTQKPWRRLFFSNATRTSAGKKRWVQLRHPATSFQSLQNSWTRPPMLCDCPE